MKFNVIMLVIRFKIVIDVINYQSFLFVIARFVLVLSRKPTWQNVAIVFGNCRNAIIP